MSDQDQLIRELKQSNDDLRQENKKLREDLSSDDGQMKLSEKEIEEQSGYLEDIQHHGATIYGVEPDEHGVWRYRCVTGNLKSTGFSPGQIIGKTPQECVPQILDRARAVRIEQAWSHCIDSGRTYVYEEYVPGIEDTWWQNILIPIKDTEDKVNRLIHYVVDITAPWPLREYEEAISNSRDKILRRRGVTHGPFGAGAVPFFRDNQRGTYGFIGRGIEELTEYAAETFTPDTWLALNAETVNKVVQIVFSGKDLYTSEIRIETPSGKVKWISEVAIREITDSGYMAHVTGALRDITEQKNAVSDLFDSEKQLRARTVLLQTAHEQLQAEMDVSRRLEAEARVIREALAQVDRQESMGHLAGAIAHELNQPLTGILSNAQAAEILVSRSDYDSIGEILTDVIDDAKRAGTVLRNLRHLYRRQDVPSEAVDLNTLVGDTLAMFNSQFVERGVSVETRLAKSIPTVVANRVQIQQVLINLLNNAQQMMEGLPPSGRSIVVRVQANGDDTVTVIVDDTGPGIEVDRLEKVFESLHTTRPGGLGMGLAICQSILNAHGGRIWAENRDTGGARIVFELPSTGEEL